jgi:hypothetical protein
MSVQQKVAKGMLLSLFFGVASGLLSYWYMTRVPDVQAGQVWYFKSVSDPYKNPESFKEIYYLKILETKNGYAKVDWGDGYISSMKFIEFKYMELSK